MAKFEDDSGLKATDILKRVGLDVLFIDPTYFRPTEVDTLLGDPTKAKKKLGWQPKYDLKMLVEDMVSADLQLFRKDLHLVEASYRLLKKVE